MERLYGAISYLVWGLIVTATMTPSLPHMKLPDWALLFVAALPFLKALVYWMWFRGQMKVDLKEHERQTEANRKRHLTLSGITFAAFFLLIVEAAKLRNANPDFTLATLAMLIASVLFFAAFSFEAYKFARWQEEFVDAIDDAGRLLFLLGCVALLWQTAFPIGLVTIISLAIAVGWIVNFAIHARLRWKYLRNLVEYGIDQPA